MLNFKLDKTKQLLRITKSDKKSELQALVKYFRVKSRNFYWNPLYKRGLWDGYDIFLHGTQISSGLWMEIKKCCDNNKIKFKIDGLEKILDVKIEEEKFLKFVDILLEGTKYIARNYQKNGAFKILKYKYCVEELATSAGKTLISFIVFTYLKWKKKINKNNKLLLIVPKVGLLLQTAEKFEKDYNNGLLSFNMMLLGGNNKFKQETYENADLIISTYQSLNNQSKEFFTKIRHINVDEVHYVVGGDSIKKVIKQCNNLEYRFGLSGTVPDDPKCSDYFIVQEYLGPIVLILKAKYLMKARYSPYVKVKQLTLKHNWSIPEIDDYLNSLQNTRDDYSNADEFGMAMYNLEKQVIIKNKERLDFIVNFTLALNKNSLILFNNVKDQYGFEISQKLKEVNDDVYYIDGSINDKDRENFRKIMETKEKAVLVASYGVFSIGIDIENIHYIIFVESYKSETLIRQSIGRGMRKLKGKRMITIVDLVDDFGKYSKRHAREREIIYKKENFEITKHDYKL